MTKIIALFLLAGLFQACSRKMAEEESPFVVDGVSIGSTLETVYAVPGMKPVVTEEGNLVVFENYANHDAGLQFVIDRDGVGVIFVRWNTFVAPFEDANTSSHKPFKGTLLFRDRKISLNFESTPDHIRSIFGEPFWEHLEKFQDGTSELWYFYEYKSCELQVGFTTDNTLSVFIIQKYHELADADYRKELGVTKGWPPEWQ